MIFGRTNTPEFGAKGITEPDAWGPARNPWNLDHTPGGSSGGSAAAVAAGIVPMAGGNDGGGSIRLPAGHCGLFGLKPGRGRTPWGPAYGELMHGAAMNHVLTRSVRDSAAMLDATHGPEIGSMYHIAPPERPYLEEVGARPGQAAHRLHHALADRHRGAPGSGARRSRTPRSCSSRSAITSRRPSPQIDGMQLAQGLHRDVVRQLRGDGATRSSSRPAAATRASSSTRWRWSPSADAQPRRASTSTATCAGTTTRASSASSTRSTTCS